MEKEIIILAKSNKRGSFCVAGIDTETGCWIRPVSENSSTEGAVPICDLKYEDGSELQILDKVRITFKSEAPTFAQPENYIYDSDFYWEKTGVCSIDDVLNIRGLDDVETVFYNEVNKVLNSEMNSEPSLLLLSVDSPAVAVKTFEAKTVRFCFYYKGVAYNYFSVSDPKLKSKFEKKKDNYYHLKNHAIVVLSLTDKHTDGNHYKMLAQYFG